MELKMGLKIKNIKDLKEGVNIIDILKEEKEQFFRYHLLDNRAFFEIGRNHYENLLWGCINYPEEMKNKEEMVSSFIKNTIRKTLNALIDKKEIKFECVKNNDHVVITNQEYNDYVMAEHKLIYEPIMLDEEIKENKKLREEIETLKREIKELKKNS